MKALYVIACCVLVAAIACQLNSLRHAAHSMTVLAKAASVGEAESVAAKQEADADARDCDRSSLAGMVLAALGVVLWIGSWAAGRQHNKRLTHVWMLVLLIAYAALFVMRV